MLFLLYFLLILITKDGPLLGNVYTINLVYCILYLECMALIYSNVTTFLLVAGVNVNIICIYNLEYILLTWPLLCISIIT